MQSWEGYMAVIQFDRNGGELPGDTPFRRWLEYDEGYETRQEERLGHQD